MSIVHQLLSQLTVLLSAPRVERKCDRLAKGQALSFIHFDDGLGVNPGFWLERAVRLETYPKTVGWPLRADARRRLLPRRDASATGFSDRLLSGGVVSRGDYTLNSPQ